MIEKLRSLKHRDLILFLLIYVLIRILLFNINYTEWGDTFRMVRAAEFLSNFSWPWDEKRWPFYSILLIPGIWLNAPILWGRFIAIIISVTSLIYIYAFYLKFTEISGSKISGFIKSLAYQHESKRHKYALYAVILTAFSPVYFYWSLRVMADPLFSLLVLVTFYYLMKWELGGKLNASKIFIISLLSLALTMTRLEGLFVFTSISFYLLITKRIKYLMLFILPQLLIYVPWTGYAKIIYDGPVNNDYVEEFKLFNFDIKRFFYFLGYTLFIMGIPILTAYFFQGWKHFHRNLNKTNYKDYFIYLPVILFVSQEIFMGFIWTPSLPRIYMPIIPFLVMIAVLGIENFAVNKRGLNRGNMMFIAQSTLFLAFFVLLQYYFKFYFLGASKILFLILIAFSFVLILLILFPKQYHRYFFALLLIGNLSLTAMVVYKHAEVYLTVKQAVEYLEKDNHIVLYSDENGTSAWYLKDRAFYLDKEKVVDDLDDQYKLAKEVNAKYLLITNEFDIRSILIDPKKGKDDRYVLVAEFEKTIIDPFDLLLDKYNIVKLDPQVTFKTKIYEIK